MKPTPVLKVISAMLAALGVIAIAAWVAWSLIADDRTAAGNGAARTIQVSANIGGPFELINQRGETVTDASFRGRYMLIYFGYSYCPDICPTGLLVMAAALEAMGLSAKNIVPVFVSIDPARDRPGVLKDYVAILRT